ncbi:glycoside hydrolase family 30 protein [Teratosphaeria destructans]|uniref:Glycoside hydrolase family 30 protein n=1 Tax=Teratosphaeria destructans TaxID=418781 RepID=A0A9W7SJ03_9PEZI|nr:glycoside hydrolase family 30 protein [Teratosphaeria destructans]
MGDCPTPHVAGHNGYKQLGDFLFSEDGLHLSSYRYNVGADGGDDSQPVTNWGNRVESFLLRDGTYDWSRDHAGVTFLAMAQQYAVPYITYFLNAAPSHIAGNGAACGWDLTSDEIPAFAEYIQIVLSYWLDHGVDIKYISPVNEPDNNRSDCGQEGMSVTPSLRAPLAQAIRAALDNSTAKKVDLIFDETSRVVEYAGPEYPIWLPDAASSLSNIAVHNYDYPNDTALATYYQLVQNLTGSDSPPVMFTETCCSTRGGSGPSVFGAQYDPTMENALIVGRYVWQYLTIVQAHSFDWWTAVTTLPCSPTVDGDQCITAINNTAGYNSGLVYIDGNYNDTQDYSLHYVKRAYLMKHLALHRPGSVRYDVPQSQLPADVNAIASKGPVDAESGKQTWNVLFMNNQTTCYNLSLAVPEADACLQKVFETTDAQDWLNVSPLPTQQDGVVSIELPAKSLVTLQFQ